MIHLTEIPHKKVEKLLCILAFFVFAVLSVFSARYRPLAKEAFACVFKTVTLKPCDTGMDDRLKAEVVSGLLKVSPAAARTVNRHFTVLSWVFVLLTLGSFAYTAFGAYNFYFYGNCDGPQSSNICILNDLTGDYGRFSEPQELVPPENYSGITSGSPDAEIVIVEFGCFTCPYTMEAESAVSLLLKKYDAYYVFKPFPLPRHQQSYEAAKAVLCAERQGMHYQLKNRIFAEQMECSGEGELDLENMAEQAGLDMEEFNSCFRGGEVSEELDAFVQQGYDSNIYATPTFFINGEAMVGPQTLQEFESRIEEMQNESQ
ncbi:thioredoxin domain-containing protein [Candidatus Micrarchaeota archaeon]|nr:thioredoxin domain-containing protein [Candidatus Micrarchaeota archaeon]